MKQIRAVFVDTTDCIIIQHKGIAGTETIAEILIFNCWNVIVNILWRSDVAKQLVYCEVDPITEIPIRIIRNYRDAYALDPKLLRQMARKVAVEYIRNQVIDRARRGAEILCEFCGDRINEFIGEMHEVIPKGQGGEVSVDNSRFLCHDCHIGKKDSEHGARRWHTANLENLK